MEKKNVKSSLRIKIYNSQIKKIKMDVRFETFI